jgi:hypothetical protein
VREAAGECAALADRIVRDVLDDLGEKLARRPGNDRAMKRGVPCERPDAQAGSIGLQKIEFGYAVHVEKLHRTRQPEVHHRHEALAAGEDLALCAVLGKKGEQFVERARRVVLERGGLHFHLTRARSHACTRVALTIATISTETMTA